MNERLKLSELNYCWNCNGKLHKIDEEQNNKYHCPKCQMDFILDSFEVTVTYQYEKSSHPYKKNENEPKKHRLAEYVGN